MKVIANCQLSVTTIVFHLENEQSVSYDVTTSATTLRRQLRGSYHLQVICQSVSFDVTTSVTIVNLYKSLSVVVSIVSGITTAFGATIDYNLHLHLWQLKVVSQ